jgi:SPX domain protein involved in polyphosphate accumulation
VLKLQLQVSASVCKLIRHPKISWLNNIVHEALDLWSLSCRGKSCSGQGIALEICKAQKRTNSFFLLNCAAAVKILKKHDKCTGSDLRWNYIHHVEAQRNVKDSWVLVSLNSPLCLTRNWTWSMVI